MPNYGVHASEKATSISTPVLADVALPFVVGTAPVHTATSATPAKQYIPCLVTSWDEAVSKLGYSADWKAYTLCEFMYSHFQNYQMQPVIFCNVLDGAKNTKPLAGKSYPVVDKVATIDFNATQLTIARGVDGEDKAEKHATFTMDDGEWKGIKSADLVCPGTFIATDGKVYGNIPYATANAQFGEGKEEGYYLPVQLGDTYKEKKYKLTREGMGGESASLNGTSSTFENDTQMVVSLGKDATEAKKAIVKFYDVTDSEEPFPGEKQPFLTLAFANANFLEKGDKRSFEADTDYAIEYDGDNNVCHVELLSEDATACETIFVEGRIASVEEINEDEIIKGVNAIDQAMTVTGKIPDLLLAPGWSQKTAVAAVMAAKVENISSLFTGKVLMDIDTSADGVTDYSGLTAYKNKNNFVDMNEVLCWPMVKLGDKTYHMSTSLAGLMATVDNTNNSVPYESPSNKNLKMDACVLEDGTEVNLTFEQANLVRDAGIFTALNFMNMGWVAWGGYTACYPANTDVKDYFLNISRMFDYVKTTLIKTFWSKIDKPMTRRIVDNIIDTTNIWLNGLVAAEYLYGARVELISDENPLTDLMQGIIKVHVFLAPPPPLQECDFILEYDPSYIESALMG